MADLWFPAFVLFAACSLASGLLYWVMHKSVNDNLPADQRMLYLSWRHRFGRWIFVLRTYNEMFPRDAVLLMYCVFQGIAVLVWFVMLLESMKRRAV